MNITFVKYHGHKNPKTQYDIDTTLPWYAIPGGGIAPRDRIVSWAREYGHTVKFMLPSYVFEGENEA